MCGLAGVILNQNKSLDELQYGIITDVFKGILVKAQARGNHASGFGVVFDTKEYLLHKDAVDATHLIADGDTDANLGLVDSTTTAIIGHTRFATQGDVNTNSNNHPIRAGNVIGTHNGWVSNDDSLFRQFNLYRHAEVDSEVLFRMINEANSPDEFFEKMLPKAQGKITAVWSDVEFPEIIYILKGNNPLSLIYVKELGALFYASLEYMITGVLDGMNIRYKKVKINSGTAVRFNTKKWTAKTRKIDFVGMNKNVIRYSWEKPIGKKFTFSEKRKTKSQGPVLGSCKMPETKKLKGETTNKTIKGFVPRYSYKQALSLQTANDLKRWEELDEAVADAKNRKV